MTETGLRERKKAERRTALTAAARELVARDGLDGVTVEAICAAVGVSPRTFFNYYETKEDAVLGVHLGEELHPDAEVTRTFVAGGPTGDLLTDGAALVASVIAGWMPPQEGEALMRLVTSEPRLLARHVAWLERGREATEALVREREVLHPTGIDPVVTTGVIGSLVRTSALMWKSSGQGSPTDYLARAVEQVRLLAAVAP